MESRRLTFVWKPDHVETIPTLTPSPRKKRLAEKVKLHKSQIEWQEKLLKHNSYSVKKFSPVEDGDTTPTSVSQNEFQRVRAERIAKKKKISPYHIGKAEKEFILGMDYGYLKFRPNFIFKRGDVINPKPSEVKVEEYNEFMFANGDKYEGHYTIDPTVGPRRSGIGKYTKPNGSVFLGEWFADKLYGDNCYVSLPTEKVRYKGGVRNGKFHGLGTYRGPEGLYQGSFWHGKFIGRGRFIDSEGFTWIGTFRCTNAINLNLHLETICDILYSPSKISV